MFMRRRYWTFAIPLALMMSGAAGAAEDEGALERRSNRRMRKHIVNALILMAAMLGGRVMESAETTELGETASAWLTQEERDLKSAKSATARFHDVNNAIAAGYVQVTPCIELPGGTIGIFFENASIIEVPAGTDPETGMPLHMHLPPDPEAPVDLLYVPDPNEEGGLRLVGVQYISAALADGIDDGYHHWFGSEPPPNPNPPASLFGQTFSGPFTPAPGFVPWFYYLRVWLWSHNPAGLFAEVHPSLSCG